MASGRVVMHDARACMLGRVGPSDPHLNGEDAEEQDLDCGARSVPEGSGDAVLVGDIAGLQQRGCPGPLCSAQQGLPSACASCRHPNIPNTTHGPRCIHWPIDPMCIMNPAVESNFKNGHAWQ